MMEMEELSPMVRLRPKAALAILVLACFDTLVSWVECSVSQAEIEQHLSLGMQLLARQQYSDALSHFHAAVDADSSNYMSFYKRATVFLALSRPRPALADLDRVLELKKDFLQARVQRALVLFKMGRLDEAHIDAEKVLRENESNEEANRLYSQIESLKTEIVQADEMVRTQNYQMAVEILTSVLEQIPWSPSLREQRANAYLGLNNLVHALSDLRTTAKLRPDDTESRFKVAELHYRIGEAEESLTEIRECLVLDPEHKQCFPFYKKLKKVAKAYVAARQAQEEERWDECVEQGEKILKLETSEKMVLFEAHRRLCRCKLKKGDAASEAVKSCSEALRLKEDEPALLCDRAEAYMADDMLDEAVNDYRKALDLDEDLRRAKEGLQTAQKRQKQAKKRDYYKILGVKRNARKKEIMKAYRKLAQKWHPDNFQNEDEKKSAEKKFMDIAAAKEVLTDQEMRQKYDRGEDPLDPEDQQRSQNPFHHFHQGGNPFGNGNFQFKFHFN